MRSKRVDSGKSKTMPCAAFAAVLTRQMSFAGLVVKESFPVETILRRMSPVAQPLFSSKSAAHTSAAVVFVLSGMKSGYVSTAPEMPPAILSMPTVAMRP